MLLLPNDPSAVTFVLGVMLALVSLGMPYDQAQWTGVLAVGMIVFAMKQRNKE